LPTPPPFGGFVANKRLTTIRPNGDRAVEGLFSRFFGPDSRSIFSAVPIADFTLWLIGKTLLIAAILMTDFAGFQRPHFQRNAAWAAGSLTKIHNASRDRIVFYSPCQDISC
jgi:hypothetical protein